MVIEEQYLLFLHDLQFPDSDRNVLLDFIQIDEILNNPPKIVNSSINNYLFIVEYAICYFYMPFQTFYLIIFNYFVVLKCSS